jgi:hypothetical protein
MICLETQSNVKTARGFVKAALTDRALASHITSPEKYPLLREPSKALKNLMNGFLTGPKGRN